MFSLLWNSRAASSFYLKSVDQIKGLAHSLADHRHQVPIDARTAREHKLRMPNSLRRGAMIFGVLVVVAIAAKVFFR